MLETKVEFDLITEKITAKNIKQDYLKLIFDGRSQEGFNELLQIRTTTQWEKGYEHDLMMAFWLAVHKQDMWLIDMLLSWDI